jgi:hypothetical protein
MRYEIADFLLTEARTPSYREKENCIATSSVLASATRSEMTGFFCNRSEFVGATSGIKSGLLEWKQLQPGQFYFFLKVNAAASEIFSASLSFGSTS